MGFWVADEFNCEVIITHELNAALCMVSFLCEKCLTSVRLCLEFQSSQHTICV
uniref:Uncharacterized protein n=1 Tax=Physcomitrium patens TaxID=3218 RepID=A0A2K1JYG3_PHYPA|nr:hypothetical protein PHYPA_013685 [Physcomitrium patens]